VQHHDVEFESEGVVLRGWLLVPPGPGPHPALVLTSGFGSVKELFWDHPFHEAFAAAGFTVLVYDHPHCGSSDGMPRHELDPVAQARAYQDAITFLVRQPSVDPTRIGIWGTSFSGGHVLWAAAVDRRVRCVVAQVPTISGSRSQRRRYAPDELTALRRAWEHDRVERAEGRPGEVRTQVKEGTRTAAYYDGLPAHVRKHWPNLVTLRSLELYGQYEPGWWAPAIGPTPLLMIVAADDAVTPTDECLATFAAALEPKQLLLVPGDHYAVYTSEFDRVCTAATDFFVANLVPPAGGAP